jgi:hypothetical protein
VQGIVELKKKMYSNYVEKYAAELKYRDKKNKIIISNLQKEITRLLKK